MCDRKMDSKTIENIDELEFIIFCVENLADKFKKNAKEIYIILEEKSEILDKYIIPGYEFLHTQDKDYILEDIEEVMNEQGIKI